MQVPSGSGWIDLRAGPCDYRLDYRLVGGDTTSDFTVERGDTETYGVGLTPRQLDFALTLASNRLLGRTGFPSHAEIAERWTVSRSTVERTFEHIRARLRADGVTRIGTQELLVDHLVRNGVVTLAMLEEARIGEPGGPIRQQDLRPDR